MKKTSEELKLVDHALTDESWEEYHAHVGNEGLAAIRGARKTRSRQLLSKQISTLVILFAVLCWSLNPRRPISSSTTQSKREQPNNPLASSHDTTHYITEEQMLEMFPKGSCVLAEV